jgi:hypothetical protein
MPKKLLSEKCKLRVKWLHGWMIITLFLTSVWYSKEELQCAMWPPKSTTRTSLAESSFLKKYYVDHLMNESVPMYDDLQFMYTSDLGSKPSPESSFSLTPLDIRTVVRNLPAALQHIVTVIFSLFSPDVKTWILLDTIYVITESGLSIIFMQLSSLNCLQVCQKSYCKTILSPEC